MSISFSELSRRTIAAILEREGVDFLGENCISLSTLAVSLHRAPAVRNAAAFYHHDCSVPVPALQHSKRNAVRIRCFCSCSLLKVHTDCNTPPSVDSMIISLHAEMILQRRFFHFFSEGGHLRQFNPVRFSVFFHVIGNIKHNCFCVFFFFQTQTIDEFFTYQQQ